MAFKGDSKVNFKIIAAVCHDLEHTIRAYGGVKDLDVAR